MAGWGWQREKVEAMAKWHKVNKLGYRFSRSLNRPAYNKEAPPLVSEYGYGCGSEEFTRYWRLVESPRTRRHVERVYGSGYGGGQGYGFG